MCLVLAILSSLKSAENWICSFLRGRNTHMRCSTGAKYGYVFNILSVLSYSEYPDSKDVVASDKTHPIISDVF
jgi:hypothetical protein